MKELLLVGWCVLALAGPVVVSVAPAADEGRPAIAVLPLGRVDSLIVEQVKEGIEKFFPVRVSVMTPVSLPPAAYYKPNARYRAEKLLDFLDSIIVHTDSGYVKIIGITEVDISTTKGDVYDWGIFGLGSMPGLACVVSTFRLGRGKVDQEKFLVRLVKVTNHELGHTFGLDHCPTPQCLMEDAMGTIKTVDNETGELCPDCRTRLDAALPGGMGDGP